MSTRQMNKGLAMSDLWLRPNCTDLDSTIVRALKMDTARFANIDVEGRRDTKRFAVISEKTGQIFSYPTDKYHIVQHVDVVTPIIQALHEMDVKFSGSLIENGEGRMFGIFKVDAPITVRGEAFHINIEVHNSYNCELAFGGSSGLIRGICNNGMISVCGLYDTIKQKHLEIVGEAVEDWKNAIMGFDLNTVRLQETIDSNMAKTFAWGELEEILTATKIGQRQVTAIMDNVNNLSPEMARDGPNAWNAYNAITAFYTHRRKFAYDTNREGIVKANVLLEKPIDELYATGRKMLDAMNEHPAQTP